MEKVKVVIANLNNQEIAVDFPERSIIFHFGISGIDWMQACGQKGRCTTCAFEIISGAENLSELSDNELRYKEQGRLSDNFRLACQTFTKGDIVIRVPNGLKLPHQKYSE